MGWIHDRHCHHSSGWVVLALAMVGCALAIACSDHPKASQAKRPKIEVWSWNIAAASLQDHIPLFQRNRPGIDVTINMTGARMQTRLFLGLSAGVGAPDVSQLSLTDVPKFACTRKLADLTDIYERHKTDFPEALWKVCTYEGRVYAIPWGLGPCAVFYKRSIFAKYGIDPSRIATWQDYIEAGKVIKKKSNGHTHMMHMSLQSLRQVYEILLQQIGGQVFDEQGRIAINSPESRRVLQIIRAILDSGIAGDVAIYSHEDLAALKNDTLATIPVAVWFGGTIKDIAPETAGDWGVFPLPAFEKGGSHVSNYGGSVLAIPEQGKQKEAAKTFVEFVLCDKRAQLDEYAKYDLFPALIPTFSDPFFDQPDPFYGGQKVRRLFAEGIDRITPMNRTKDWAEMLGYLDQTLSPWAMQRMSDDAYLSALEKRLSERLNRPISPSSMSFKGGGRHAR